MLGGLTCEEVLMKKVIIDIILIAIVTGISCKKENIVSPKPVTLIVTDTTAYYSDDDFSIPYEIDYDSDTYSRIVKPVVITKVSPKYPEEAGIHGWRAWRCICICIGYEHRNS